MLAALAFVASVVCFLWVVFAAIFASGIFAAGDSHPPESPDLLTPVLLGVGSAVVGVYALLKRSR